MFCQSDLHQARLMRSRNDIEMRPMKKRGRFHAFQPINLDLASDLKLNVDGAFPHQTLALKYHE